MTWSFQRTDFESLGGHIFRCCHEALDAGRMGDNARTDVYRAFISCGLEKDGGARLSTVKTSCAIFVRAVLHWCGVPAPRDWVPGWPMFGGPRRAGWLGDLSMHHPAWVKWTGSEVPEMGSVFFIDKPGTNNNHVGVLLEPTGNPGEWHTAEGGGGDGTDCSLSTRTLGPHFDKWGRKLEGWWIPSVLASQWGLTEETDVEKGPTEPAPPDNDNDPPPEAA